MSKMSEAIKKCTDKQNNCKGCPALTDDKLCELVSKVKHGEKVG